MSEAKSSTRLLFVDNVRIFLTFLVVMHHTLITYGGSGGWYFKDPLTDKVTSFVFSVLCGLKPGLFHGPLFLYQCVFRSGSYTRKKTWQFLSDRLIRLGIPIIIYSSIINPIMVYLLSSKTGKAILGVLPFIFSIRCGFQRKRSIVVSCRTTDLCNLLLHLARICKRSHGWSNSSKAAQYAIFCFSYLQYRHFGISYKVVVPYKRGGDYFKYPIGFCSANT